MTFSHHRIKVPKLEELEILILEDSRPTRAILETIFSALRLSRLQWCNDLADCKRRICTANGRPDIIIADVPLHGESPEPMAQGQNAPDGSNGMKLLKWIRQDPGASYAQLPVILLSTANPSAGQSPTGLAAAAKQAGAHTVLAKPVSMEALYKSLLQLSERPPAFVRSESYFGPDRRSKSRGPHPVERRKQPPTGHEKAAG